MDDRPTRDHGDDDAEEAVTPSDITEGVRIIGAEEAAQAMERGDVAPRRGEGEPRYGDRPSSPASPEERPALRFPLADDETAGGRPRPTAAPSPELPHWTEPPTGEVPRLGGDEEPAGDDLEAWSSFAGGVRWRSEHQSDWDDADFDDASIIHDEETRVGALDETERPSPGDYFGFEEEEEPVPAARPVAAPPPAPARPRVQPHTRTTRPRAIAEREPTDRDIGASVITGLAIAAVALILFSMGSGPTMVLVTAVIVVAAAELFAALQRGGYQPATLLGLVACGSLATGAYWRGEAAIPLVLGLTVIFAFLWYLMGVSRAEPTTNAAVTVFAVAYVGLPGAFAALILTYPNGIGVLLAVIVGVVANDVGALFAGRRMGSSPLAPSISPNKTVEGAIGGALATVTALVLIFGLIGIHPWDAGSALALALVVAVAAPLGDLCESMIKRDLGIKDMGDILPGHGGVLDRFDTLLFALPAAFYLTRLLEVF